MALRKVVMCRGKYAKKMKSGFKQSVMDVVVYNVCSWPNYVCFTHFVHVVTLIVSHAVNDDSVAARFDTLLNNAKYTTMWYLHIHICMVKCLATIF